MNLTISGHHLEVTLVDKLDRQVVKHKDRLQNHHHQSPKRLM